jgi:hypothetical protein
MGIDSSIYQAAKPIAINIPSPLDAAESQMKLSTLGMQQQQMGYQMAQQRMQMQQQQAMRQAYADNTDPTTGQLNRQGALSQIGQTNPMAASQLSNQWAEQDKNAAEAKSAQLAAAQSAVTVSLPGMEVLNSMPEDQRAAAFPAYAQQWEKQGVNMPNFPKTSDGTYLYDPNTFNQAYQNLTKTKQYLDQQTQQTGLASTQAGTAKTLAETKQLNTGAALNAELYGSRSPYSTQQDAYNKEPAVATAHQSQVYMQQMLGGYKDPTPQGDASLIINAFRIKNPGAPDVNSLKEMSEAQGIPDQWKNLANKSLNGGMDQPTRDNIMRDGAVAYNSNIQSLSGTQQKYQQIAKLNNLPNSNFTTEPAIDKTNSEVAGLQSKIGPYLPPAQRGGIMSGVANLFGGGSQSSPAQAAGTAAQTQTPSSKGNVTQDTAAKYATKHNMTLSGAISSLTSQGYVVDGK